MLERGDRKGSLWYKSQSKSKRLLTLENKRHVPTEVMWLLFPKLFLPEIMSLLLSTLHLCFPSLPPPSWKTKTPLIIVDYKWETAELHTTTKKSMLGFWKKMKALWTSIMCPSAVWIKVLTAHFQRCPRPQLLVDYCLNTLWCCCVKVRPAEQRIHTCSIVKHADIKKVTSATITARLLATPLGDSDHAHLLYSFIKRWDS